MSSSNPSASSSSSAPPAAAAAAARSHPQGRPHNTRPRQLMLDVACEFDGVISVVSQILQQFQDTDHIEIELKLGTIIDKETKSRIQLPVMSDTVFSRVEEFKNSYEFQSGIHFEHYKFLNALLNTRTSELAQSDDPISYKRIKETDFMHESNIRVTKNPDGETVRILKKSRLLDIDIFCPNMMYDLRLSVSEEKPVTPSEVRQPFRQMRKKERLSYKFQGFSFDLTWAQTDYASSSRPSDTRFELEVELREPTKLQDELRLASVSEPNGAYGIIQGLYYNVKSMVSKCTVAQMQKAVSQTQGQAGGSSQQPHKTSQAQAQNAAAEDKGKKRARVQGEGASK